MIVRQGVGPTRGEGSRESVMGGRGGIGAM